MESDPTQRFSSRVADYVRYRPSYPEAILSWLADQCGLTPHSQIADIGSGTGILSSLFLRLGCQVDGVEPNADMRSAGERLLGGEPGFRGDRKSTRLNSSHLGISYAVFCLINKY